MDTLQEAMVSDETLDPPDWSDMQALSHRIIDDAVAYLKNVRDRPVWREMPADVRSFFSAPVPHEPASIADVYDDVARNVMAYPMGNIHPRFWSWYMGSSNFT
ncbi:MAG: amino acid decarboxylase, partial [Mesorhizobium sp.]